MIEAYLDETGIHDGAAYCAIAGYFAGKGQWKKFEQCWRKALADFDVPLEKFHALDLMKRHKAFFGWQDQKHQAFLERLAEAITKYKIYPVSAGIIIEDFTALSLTQRRFLTGATMFKGKAITSGCPNRPYFTPFQFCIKCVVSYAEVGGKAHFFFGLDRPFAKYAQALYANLRNSKQPDPTRERLGTIGFPLASKTPQLQAADLLAYMTAEHVAKNNYQPETPPGPFLRALLDKTRMQMDHVLYNKEVLIKSISGVVGIAPILAFEKEDEEEIPK
jgi:hypothetical protein